MDQKKKKSENQDEVPPEPIYQDTNELLARSNHTMVTKHYNSV